MLKNGVLTGDIAQKDSEGYIYITGRYKTQLEITTSESAVKKQEEFGIIQIRSIYRIPHAMRMLKP